MPSGELETTTDRLEYLSFCSDKKERDMYYRMNREHIESCYKEGVLCCVLILAERLLALCSSSSACKVERRVLIFFKFL